MHISISALKTIQSFRKKLMRQFPENCRKEGQRDGRKDGRTEGRTDSNSRIFPAIPGGPTIGQN